MLCTSFLSFLVFLTNSSSPTKLYGASKQQSMRKTLNYKLDSYVTECVYYILINWECIPGEQWTFAMVVGKQHMIYKYTIFANPYL